MTARKKSLLTKGVLKEDFADTSHLVSKSNINQQKLQELAGEVSDFVKLPPSCTFAKTMSGENDVSIFDFSKKKRHVNNQQN